MRASLEALQKSPSNLEFEKNKSNLVRSLRQDEVFKKVVKMPPPKQLRRKQNSWSQPELCMPREVENELSPYNITQTIRLNWLKSDIEKLPTYLRPNINALYFHKYRDRIYVPDEDEPLGLPDLGQIKTLQEMEKNKKPFVYKIGGGTVIECEQENDFYVLPDWAQVELEKIKKRPAGIFDLEKTDFEHQLSKFTCKEVIKTIMAMGVEKILLWLKSRDALLRLEAGDKMREKMKAEGTWKVIADYQPSPHITLEEKERLMELILKQSEQLMVYDIYWNSGCSNKLAARKLKQRTRLPLISDEHESKNKRIVTFHYTLPYWAFEELKRIMDEKQLPTTDEEASYCLEQFLKLPKYMRKPEIEKKMEKGKKKLLKYLKVMKTVRNTYIVPPQKENKFWNTSEAFKEKLLQRHIEKKKQSTCFPGIDIEEDYTGEASQQRLKEKINLEEKILMMDAKLSAFNDYLKTTKEVISTRKVNPVPKFIIPSGKTDVNPEHYSVVNGRPIPLQKFNRVDYLSKVKKIFITNLVKGLKEDNAAMKEQQDLRQIDYLFKILDEINYYTEAFNVYLFENQEDIMINMKTYTNIGHILVLKEREIEEAQKIFKILKPTLLSLGGLLKFRRMCQTTLYDLAPYHWRAKYDKEKEKVQPLADKAADHILSHLAHFKMNTLVPQPFLFQLIIFLADTLRNLGPPANYFKSGFEIDLAIEELELENLHAIQTAALFFTKKKELIDAQENLETLLQKQIGSFQQLLKEKLDQVKSELQRIKKIDKRSEEVVQNYWRVVSTNESILHSFAHIKSLFDEFVADQVVPTDDPVEMLTALANDIIETQGKVLNIPSASRNSILELIKEKENKEFVCYTRAREQKHRVDKLIKSMKRSYGLSVGQQGHPPRYRSKASHTNLDAQGLEKDKSSIPISHNIMERVITAFEPTQQDGSLIDTLTAFEKIQAQDRSWRFFPGCRNFNEGPSSDFEEDESSPVSLLDSRSSNQSLTGENIGKICGSVLKRMKDKPKSVSSSLSEICPSITEESASQGRESSNE